MLDKELIIETKGQTLWLTINRPDKRNALSLSVIEGIREALTNASHQAELRAIVLTGTGHKAFCAGADLAADKAFKFDTSVPNLAYADMLRAAQRCNLPIIVAINGVCMAGGIGLLAMADMAVSTDTAQFGLPEVKVGVFPMQVLSLLKGLVAPRLVNEWCITGEPFTAQEALEAGLLNYVVPADELYTKTQWLIERITNKSPTAIRRGKYALRAIAHMSFDEAIAFTESQIALLGQTEDAREGILAFQEKRLPSWTGR